MSPEEQLARLGVRQLPPLAVVARDKRNLPPISEKVEDEPAAELPVISAAAFAGKPVPPRRWILQDMIPDRTVSIVAGDGGDGKTTLMLQLAAAMAGTKPWLGYNPESGGVLFVSAEDDLDENHRRLAAIAISLGVALAGLGDLHIVPLAGKDAVMATPQAKVGLLAPTAVFHGLVALVERIKPRLVILDALADVFGGEEIARAQARQFISLLRGLAIDHNLAVVLIAHPSLNGMKEGTSGSTAWSNSVRSRLYLERVKDGEREIDANRRVLSVKKSNYGPVGLELRLRWSNGAFVLDGPATGFDKLAAEAKAETVFLALLRAYDDQGRRVSPNPGSNYAPVVFAGDDDAEGVTNKALARAMTKLLKANRIHIEKVGPQSRQRDKLTPGPAPAKEASDGEGATKRRH